MGFPRIKNTKVRSLFRSIFYCSFLILFLLRQYYNYVSGFQLVRFSYRLAYRHLNLSKSHAATLSSSLELFRINLIRTNNCWKIQGNLTILFPQRSSSKEFFLFFFLQSNIFLLRQQKSHLRAIAKTQNYIKQFVLLLLKNVSMTFFRGKVTKL